MLRFSCNYFNTAVKGETVQTEETSLGKWEMEIKERERESEREFEFT